MATEAKRYFAEIKRTNVKKENANIKNIKKE